MAFSEIVAPTLRELFVRQILEMIFSGELKPGDRLPPERELAETMKISRSMVHVGLEDLERMGFVTVEPRKCAYVANYTENGNFETLGAIVRYHGGNFPENMNISFVEMRNAIEGGAMIRLGKTRTQEDLNRLRKLAGDYREALARKTDIPTLARMMREFHTEITKLSGNSLFPMLMHSFDQVSLYLWEECVRFWGEETTLKQEEKLIELLERGEGHEAAHYIENIFERYLEANGLKRG